MSGHLGLSLSDLDNPTLAEAPLSSPRPRYEFTTCEADNYKLLSAEANKLGAEGWQLVTVDDVKLAHQTVVGFFQREVV